jgi:hypothetical protein
MRWIIEILAIVIIGAVRFLGVQVTRIDSRVSSLESKVDTLPDKINSNLLNLAKAFSEAITASKQQPPQILLMPNPAPQNNQTK